MWLASLKASNNKTRQQSISLKTAQSMAPGLYSHRPSVYRLHWRNRGGMIVQMVLWVAFGVLGCVAFAALGIWAAITDEGHTAQRRRAMEMQAISVPRHRAGDTQVLLARMGRH